MKLPKKLGREPLIEAIFEMRFKTPSPASNILPGYLFTKLVGQKTIERLPAAELPEQMRSVDQNLRYAPLIRIRWGSYLVLIGDRNVGLACGVPYLGWHDFKPNILMLVRSLSQAEIIDSVERFSLRYTDIIPSDLGRADSLLEFKLRIGQHSAEGDYFQIRVEVRKGELLHIIQIASSGVANLIDGSSRSGAAVDIDTIAMLDDMTVPQFADVLSERLDTLHTDNKAMFFDCLKPATIEKLEPSYG